MLEVPSLPGIKGKVRKATQPPEFLQILWLDVADVGVVNKDDAFDNFVCAFISCMSVELMGEEAGELAVICKGFFDRGGEVTLQEFVEGLELDSGRGVGMSEGEVVDALDFGELKDRSGEVVGGVGGQVHGGPLQGRLAGDLGFDVRAEVGAQHKDEQEALIVGGGSHPWPGEAHHRIC